MVRQELGKVVLTSVPASAGGGIHALHKLLLESEEVGGLFKVFTISSPRPFDETIVRRAYRLLQKYSNFCLLLLKDVEVSVVHINTSPDKKAILRDAPLVILSKILGKKVIIQVHGGYNDYNLSPLTRSLLRHIISAADKILVLSSKDKASIVNDIPAANVEALSNGVRVNDYAYPKKRAGNDWRIPEHFKVVLFVGRLGAAKGVGDFLTCVPKVLQAVDNVVFVIAGDGPDKSVFKQKCQDIGVGDSVLFAGNLNYEQVRNAYLLADVFVLPSYSEAMPMTVLEALASGIPIVATSVGAVPEVLKEGVNGFLVDPGDVNMLGDRIVRILTDAQLAEKMAKANKELAFEEYDIRHLCNKLISIYNQLLP